MIVIGDNMTTYILNDGKEDTFEITEQTNTDYPKPITDIFCLRLTDEEEEIFDDSLIINYFANYLGTGEIHLRLKRIVDNHGNQDSN